MNSEDFQNKHHLLAKAGALAAVVRLMRQTDLTLTDLQEYSENGGMEGERERLQRHRKRNINIAIHAKALEQAHNTRRTQRSGGDGSKTANQ